MSAFGGGVYLPPMRAPTQAINNEVQLPHTLDASCSASAVGPDKRQKANDVSDVPAVRDSLRRVGAL